MDAESWSFHDLGEPAVCVRAEITADDSTTPSKTTDGESQNARSTQHETNDRADVGMEDAPETELPKFVWEALPGRTNIRLLRILHQSSESDPRVATDVDSISHIWVRSQSILRCELKSYSREEAINLGYIAMSYTWGTYHKPLHRIVCNGQSMEVRANCHNMLLKLQIIQPGGRFWIDAICINQSDTNERNEQVSQMGVIFQLARYTMVYLTKRDYQTPRAPSVSLPSFRHIPDVGLRRATVEREYRGAVEEDGTSNDVATLRPEIYFHSPWFTRTWIVQEIMLSETLFFCSEGDGGLAPWATVLEAYDLWSRDFQMHDRPDVVRLRALSDNAGLNGIKSPTCAAPCEHSIPAFVVTERSCQVCELALKAKNLLDILMRTRESKCIEPRDKLYAILPLLDGAWHELIVPDYSKSVLEVFTDLTILLLQNNVADVLSMASLHHPDPKWPSWVVDWSDRSPQAQRLQVQGDDIGAGCWPGVRRLHVVEIEESDVLVLRGALVCNVIEHTWSSGRLRVNVHQSRDDSRWVLLRTRQYPPLTGDMVCVFLGCKSLFLLRKSATRPQLHIVDECLIETLDPSGIHQWAGSRTRLDACAPDDIMNGGALRHINPADAYGDMPCPGLQDFEIR